MSKKHHAYVKLQRHLNRQAIGFPSSRSGAELEILATIFTPREAEIATCLDYKFQSLESVFERARHFIGTLEELAHILADIQKKGGIDIKIENDISYYCNAPLVVGMYEFQLNRLTPAFIRNFDTYTASIEFGIAFLSTERPQMRTIPVSKSISIQHAVSTYDEVKTLLQRAQPPFVIMKCLCRQKNALQGKACCITNRDETCLVVGRFARTALWGGNGREISFEETLSILDRNQREGLVLQPSNTEKAEFICSCCGCCCGMLGIQKKLPIPVDFWASNYHAHIDAALCEGCGTCERRCQVGAVVSAQKRAPARIDLNRCIGCGLCIPTCLKRAIALIKKPTEYLPPRTWEELNDVIMAKKKGPWGQLKIVGKIIVDAVRTGRTDLLKNFIAPKP